ncbi:MAG TPA: hypothetical protein VE224_14475, partial [Pseudolabrys sp.]|nr:hypothetical protein [Pseudolabrys sp.]
MVTEAAIAASHESGTSGGPQPSNEPHQRDTSSKAKTLPTLRGWLMRLAVGGVAGSLLISSLIGWYAWHSERELLNQNLTATSRALLQAANRELGSPVALSRGLAASGFLERGDLPAFDEQVRRALEPYRYKLVLARSGSTQELINTELPHGAPLPKLPNTWPLAASRLNGVTVLPFQKSAVSGHWVLPIGVPVMDSRRKTSFIIWTLVPSS